MEVRSLFLGEDGHLRSGWRAMFFLAAFVVCENLFEVAAAVAISFIRPVLGGMWATALSLLVGAIVLLISSTLVGWGCAVIFERLTFRSLGWGLNGGWLKNVVLGSLIGAASMLLAAGIAAATGGIRFSFNQSPITAIGKTALITLVVFVLAGAAEEALFRGYPLQTFLRAKLVWVGVVATSLAFGVAHLGNPNVSKGLPFINTVIAGVWLAVAFFRTRSMWLPVGLHWSWNWIQAALLGIPVSGNERFAPAPVLHAMNAGPNWLTGGAYGIEGGVACTIALIISTIVVWRTKLFSIAEDPSSPPKVASAASTQ